MRTGVSAPRAHVFICGRTICFAKTGLVGGGGVSGLGQVVCHPIAVARIQIPAANQRRDNTMVIVWDQKLAAKTERRIFCFLCCSKIIASIGHV